MHGRRYSVTFDLNLVIFKYLIVFYPKYNYFRIIAQFASVENSICITETKSIVETAKVYDRGVL